jgi:hypothetical protein
MVLVVEHGTSASGRWLRRKRVGIALWIAVLEAALVVFDVVPVWPAVAVAVALFAFYWFLGRKLRNDTLRQVSWIAAASQLLIAALPLLLAFVTFAAFVALGILVLVAFAFLFLDRR